DDEGIAREVARHPTSLFPRHLKIQNDFSMIVLIVFDIGLLASEIRFPCRLAELPVAIFQSLCQGNLPAGLLDELVATATSCRGSQHIRDEEIFCIDIAILD